MTAEAPEEESAGTPEQLRAELAACRSQLEASHRELDMLCYAVSHDLRAPLRAVDGFSRMLFNRIQDRLDAEDRRLLDVVRTSATHMSQLMEDLVTYSRLTRQKLQTTTLNMATLVADAWGPLAMKHPGRFDVEPMPPACGDAALIRQVWRHLLANAVKFSAGREPAAIVARGEQKGDELVYSVQDQGVGFDPDYAHKLFQPMQRLHAAKDFAGSGFGLAAVARVVQRHGGRVGAEGAVGQGAIFWFSLPLCPPKTGDS